MTKILKIIAAGGGLAAVLTGCGGGGSGGDTPSPSPTPSPTPSGPTPAPGPVPCPDVMKRGHCTACSYQAGKTTCSACSGDYTPDSAAETPELSCVIKSCDPGAKPAKPDNVQGNNGVQWQTMCHEDLSVSRFFGIGDWGGLCDWDGKKCVDGKVGNACLWTFQEQYSTPGGVCPMPNRGNGGHYNQQIEGTAQYRVGARMKTRYDQLKADGHPPQFIVNVGDNFYPGGINVHCGQGDISTTQQQFEVAWKNVYPEPLTTELEWWGVLGNHDYGGVCYVKGWDQQIWYTYNQDKWTMPGQYWWRSVQYKNFKIDFFMVDGNWMDTDNGGQPPKHNICNRASNPGKYCEQEYYPWPGGASSVCAGTGPTSGDDCPSWFNTLWNNQYKWLMKVVPASTADWQIVNTHYPGTYNLGNAGKDLITWDEWGPKLGIDLIITGHKHEQNLFYGGDWGIQGGDWSETAMVITGGGGGVSTEAEPTNSGDDDTYGFSDYTINLTHLEIKMWSHGGVDNKMILRNSTVVTPVDKKPDEEIIRSGLDPQNLLKSKEVTV